MEIDFLLIGHGLTGEIKKHFYDGEKLNIKKLTVQPADHPRSDELALSFDVILHKYDGSTYAVGLGSSTDSIQIEGLIDWKKPKPIPVCLLPADD